MNNTESNAPETSGEHESLIKTPKQLIVVVLLAFIVPIVVIVLLVSLVSTSSRMGAGANAYNPESVAARIRPVASFKLVDANAPVVLKTGKEVFESTCAACHTTGVANAPKLGDNAAWAPYIEAGYEDLVKNAIHGVGAMPPKGGNPTLSDFEVERAVVYIANESGASFPEPAEPTDDAAADDAAEAAPAPAAEAAPATDEQPAEPAAEAPAETPVAAAESGDIDPAGEKLYKSVCFACHTTGVAGAPKTGDTAVWAPYIETGMEAMVQNAIHGIGAMPPRGGSQASDAEITAAIEYMLAQNK